MKKHALCAFLLVALPASATISQKQNPVSTWNSGSSSTCSNTFGSNPTLHDLIVVWTFWNTGMSANNLTAAVSDQYGNTFGSAVGPTLQSASNTSAQIFYAKNIQTSSGTDPLTVTYYLNGVQTAANASACVFVEYQGADVYYPLDSVSAGYSTSGNQTSLLDSGTVAPANANLLVFGGGTSDNGTATAGTNFTSIQSNGGSITEQYIPSSANNVLQRATACLSGLSPCPSTPTGHWVMQMAIFRDASWTVGGGWSAVRPGQIRFADQFPNVQAAINALPSSGGVVMVPPGTYVGPTSIPNNNTTVQCTTWLGCTFTYSTSVTFGTGTTQLSNIRLDGIIFDFGSTASGLTLDGVQYSEFRIQLQHSTATLPSAALLLTASNSGNTLTWENKFDWLNFLNVGTALVLNGDTNISGCGGTQSGEGAVFYNQFHYLNVNNASADAIDFTSGVDSNDFGFVSIVLASGNTTGHAINFGTRCPSSYGDVVFEHFYTLTVNAVQSGYSGPFLQFGQSEGAIDNFACGVNCLNGIDYGYNTTALDAGNINWQIAILAGNPYGQTNPVLQANVIVNTGPFFSFPLQTATSSVNYPCPGAQFKSSEWDLSAATFSSWSWVCSLPSSGTPSFENFALTYNGVASPNVTFLLTNPIRLGLQNVSGNNTLFVANPSTPSGNITVTGPTASTTIMTQSTGSGVPSGSCSIGALYSNTSATSASTVLYVCYPANTWTAITVP